MIHTGLVSVTFRKLKPRAIADLVAKGGLDAIEWGGDVHVPHGDLATARVVRAMTEKAGLAIPSYGSYYRVGHREPVAFEVVVNTALALGAPIIRVWAGKQGSDTADEAYWRAVIDDSVHCADLAAAAGLRIAYEYHGNTLTDTDEAALRLLETVDHPAVTTYWQLRGQAAEADDVAGLTGILPWLTHIHIQGSRRTETGSERAPLSATSGAWSRRLSVAATAPGDHVAMLEFVVGDSPSQFLADAQVLSSMVSAL